MGVSSIKVSVMKHEWDLIGLVSTPGLVLHEEHIELFSEDFKALKNEVEGKVFQRGTLHFTGDCPGSSGHESRRTRNVLIQKHDVCDFL